MKGKIHFPFAIVILQLILLSNGFQYNHVPDLVKVRRREDAGDAEFVALDFVRY